MVFCNKEFKEVKSTAHSVTILILIDGFLQFFLGENRMYITQESHNPYFNRWFSAMQRDI